MYDSLVQCTGHSPAGVTQELCLSNDTCILDSLVDAGVHRLHHLSSSVNTLGPHQLGIEDVRGLSVKTPK